ncbi:helix-turn-helix domain-containing protein [Catenuloplanes sp. NPDC051500]|uniref:helix-turn-helix domain-containing protein n=1 Tax=Catenuloplanes sp. NPDC051500 TaxID=3363959 RepID=UPI0037BD0BEC
MPTEGGSSVPRRQLGRLLRQMREEAGVKLKDAALHLEISLARMSRIEGGEAPVKLLEVRAASDLYGAPDDMREVMLGLAAASKEHGWWQAYGKAVPKWFELYVGMEEAASRLRHYEPTLIPGLLQLEAYATTVLGTFPAISEPELAQHLRVRMQRQRLLTRRTPRPPQLDVLLDESVLHRPIGDTDAWLRQLAHLVNISTRPNIGVRIVPSSAGPHWAMGAGAFVLLDFPQVGIRKVEPTTVYMENVTGALYLDLPEEVSSFETVWNMLDRRALDRDASDDLIGKVIKEYTGA